MIRNQLGQFSKGSSGETFEGYGIWYDSKGYPCIWINDRGIRLHVYVWEMEHGPKPVGFDVHHIDFRKQNYSLANLQLLSKSDHQKVHAGWVMVNGDWMAKPCSRCHRILSLTEFYPRKGYAPSALCKKCHCEKTIERLVVGGREAAIKMRNYKHEWYLIHRKSA
jgi:hypothetical protein